MGCTVELTVESHLVNFLSTRYNYVGNLKYTIVREVA